MISLLDPTVTLASAADRPQLVDIITRAFATDPPSRWMYPDDDQYWRFFPRFVEVFGGSAIEYDSAHVIGDGAVALLLPTGIHVEEAPLVAIIEESVDPRLQATAFSLFGQMASHHPRGPHWYLPLIGVRPSHQGRGYGSILLEYAATRCDRERLPAYLESTSPRSVPLYRRHGFEVVAELRVGSAPPIFPMVRQPR